MEYFVDFGEGREGGSAHGQTPDELRDIELSIDWLDQGDKRSLEYITHQHNREGSSAMVQLEAFGLPATQTSKPNQSKGTFDDVIYDDLKIYSLDQMTSLAFSETCPSVERKREKDKAYRERLKKGKLEMKYNMGALTEENMQLKNENRKLKSENTDTNQVLQSQAKEMDQLKNDLDQLKHEYKKQNALVQTLSDVLASSDLREEHQKLRNENELLRWNIGMDNQRLQLIEENVKLKHENRVLKVQVDALCEKLITDSSKNHVQVSADII